MARSLLISVYLLWGYVATAAFELWGSLAAFPDAVLVHGETNVIRVVEPPVEVQVQDGEDLLDDIGWQSDHQDVVDSSYYGGGGGGGAAGGSGGVSGSSNKVKTTRRRPKMGDDPYIGDLNGNGGGGGDAGSGSGSNMKLDEIGQRLLQRPQQQGKVPSNVFHPTMAPTSNATPTDPNAQQGAGANMGTQSSNAGPLKWAVLCFMVTTISMICIFKVLWLRDNSSARTTRPSAVHSAPPAGEGNTSLSDDARRLLVTIDKPHPASYATLAGVNADPGAGPLAAFTPQPVRTHTHAPIRSTSSLSSSNLFTGGWKRSKSAEGLELAALQQQALPGWYGKSVDGERPLSFNWEDPDTPSCAVCLGPLTGERVTRLPCQHEYHESCISPWWEKKSTCPLCKQDLNALAAGVAAASLDPQTEVGEHVEVEVELSRRREEGKEGDLERGEGGGGSDGYHIRAPRA